MDKYALAHNRIRKLAKLLRKQKRLKQAGYMPYALGGGLGAAAGGGLGALIGGKKHRGLGAGIGAGAGAGLGLLGAYLSQNAFGGSAVPATPPTTPEAPAGKPAPQAASQAASTVPTPLETTSPGAPSSPNPNVPHIDPNATVEIPPNAPVEPLDLENLPPASMTAVDSGASKGETPTWNYPHRFTNRKSETLNSLDSEPHRGKYRSATRTVGPRVTTRPDMTDTPSAINTTNALAYAIDQANNTPSGFVVGNNDDPTYISNTEAELAQLEELSRKADEWRAAQEQNTPSNVKKELSTVYWPGSSYVLFGR